MWIHQEPPQGSRRIQHLDKSGSIRIHHIYLHVDPELESTKIQNWHPPGFIAGIHLNPPLGSTRIRYVYFPGSTRIPEFPQIWGKVIFRKIPYMSRIPPDLGENGFEFLCFSHFFLLSKPQYQILVYLFILHTKTKLYKYSFLSLKLLCQING